MKVKKTVSSLLIRNLLWTNLLKRKGPSGKYSKIPQDCTDASRILFVLPTTAIDVKLSFFLFGPGPLSSPSSSNGISKVCPIQIQTECYLFSL